jgi:hypothetical protein
VLVVGDAVLVVVEVDHEAERPDATHLRPEGVTTLWARGKHAFTPYPDQPAPSWPEGCNIVPLYAL